MILLAYIAECFKISLDPKGNKDIYCDFVINCDQLFVVIYLKLFPMIVKTVICSCVTSKIYKNHNGICSTTPRTRRQIVQGID